MRIDIINGRVACIGAEKNSSFMGAADKYFFWEEYNGARYARLAPVVKEYDSAVAARRDAFTLNAILMYANRYLVDVSEGVFTYAEHLKETVAGLEEKERREWKEKEEEKRRKSLSDSLKRNGCGKCENLRRVGEDAFFCGVVGKELDTKNVPTYDYETQMMYLINIVAFPCEGCPKI